MLQLYPAGVTVLAVLFYIGTIFNAGMARGQYKVAAPATTGHPVFERALRVQANTLEHLVVFLPALWICAMYVSWVWTSAFALLWIPLRLVYAVVYMRNPDGRGPWFIAASLVELVLLAGAIVGVIGGFLK